MVGVRPLPSIVPSLCLSFPSPNSFSKDFVHNKIRNFDVFVTVWFCLLATSRLVSHKALKTEPENLLLHKEASDGNISISNDLCSFGKRIGATIFCALGNTNYHHTDPSKKPMNLAIASTGVWFYCSVMMQCYAKGERPGAVKLLF